MKLQLTALPAILLLALVPLSAGAAAPVDCGTEPGTVSAVLEDGKLTVSGEGEIKESAFAGNADIVTLTVEDGITAIGENAFCGCSRLTTVSLPDSLASIGTQAFTSCEALNTVNLSAGLTEIGSYGFYNCPALKQVNLGEGGQAALTLGNFAFACSGLTAVSIPANVAGLGSFAFYNCPSLAEVTLPDSLSEMTLGDYVFFYSPVTNVICGLVYEDSDALKTLFPDQSGITFTGPAASTFSEGGPAAVALCGGAAVLLAVGGVVLGRKKAG